MVSLIEGIHFVRRGMKRPFKEAFDWDDGYGDYDPRPIVLNPTIEHNAYWGQLYTVPPKMDYLEIPIQFGFYCKHCNMCRSSNRNKKENKFYFELIYVSHCIACMAEVCRIRYDTFKDRLYRHNDDLDTWNESILDAEEVVTELMCAMGVGPDDKIYKTEKGLMTKAQLRNEIREYCDWKVQAAMDLHNWFCEKAMEDAVLIRNRINTETRKVKEALAKVIDKCSRILARRSGQDAALMKEKIMEYYKKNNVKKLSFTKP